MNYKTQNYIYWISTIWLCLGMLSSEIVQLIQHEKELESISSMGYPAYFLSLLGAWKILGIFTILIPKYTLFKEWAYAGFVFLCQELYIHI